MGFGYWSLAAFLKFKAKSAVKFVTEYETTLATMARSHQADGVICATSTAVIKTIDGVQYLNCGDWVESCTALIEDFDGKIKLVHFMKMMLCVLGEGCGHMTCDGGEGMADAAGHQVVAVTLGASSHRPVPEYFGSAMKVPVTQLPMLEFKYKNKAARSATPPRSWVCLPIFRGTRASSASSMKLSASRSRMSLSTSLSRSRGFTR